MPHRQKSLVPHGQKGASRPRTETNRRNAPRSTGPKNTTSTRFNAVKHELLAEGVTELDSREFFPDFCGKPEAELKPVGELEMFLMRRIALTASASAAGSSPES